MVVEDEMRGGVPSPSVSWASPHAEGLAPRETLWGFHRALEALSVKLWS